MVIYVPLLHYSTHIATMAICILNCIMHEKLAICLAAFMMQSLVLKPQYFRGKGQSRHS